MNSAYSCVNCRLSFDQQADYKIHYKSELHRYNVKRRLIGLMPLSFQEYTVQFEAELSSKSSTQNELHCQLCSKKFLSPQTYKQHLNSQKHKNNRKKLLHRTNHNQSDSKSETSSCSEFSLIDQQKQKITQCLFCSAPYTKQHMLQIHNFPPFHDQCTNISQLTDFARSHIQQGHCLICSQTFQCQESAKQHMMDASHAKLDTNNFSPYERFYLWKIEQSSEEQTQFQNLHHESNENQQENFQQLKKQTLQSLERKRLERIQMTNIGYMINGKEVGSRDLKQYYKQYLGREIPKNPLREQKCLTNGDEWKIGHTMKQLMPCRYDKQTGIQHR